RWPRDWSSDVCSSDLNQPRVLPLNDLLRHFIDHRKSVVIRRTRFDLKKALERAHLLRGLALALANIDQVIKIIRASKDPKEAKEIGRASCRERVNIRV